MNTIVSILIFLVSIITWLYKMLTLKEGGWMIYRDFTYSLCNLYVSLKCFKEFLIFFKYSIKQRLSTLAVHLKTWRTSEFHWPSDIPDQLNQSLVGATQALLFELFEWFQCAHTPLYKKLLDSSSLMLYLSMDMKVSRQDKISAKPILEISVKYLLTTTAHFLAYRYT